MSSCADSEIELTFKVVRWIHRKEGRQKQEDAHFLHRALFTIILRIRANQSLFQDMVDIGKVKFNAGPLTMFVLAQIVYDMLFMMIA